MLGGGPQEDSNFVGFNAIWVVLHLIYFSWYYSKYSACFHKLARLESLEKSKFYEQKDIDRTRSNTWKRIQQFKRIAYFPIIAIALTHVLGIIFFWGKDVFIEQFMAVIYVAAGAGLFIFLANETQGSKVLGRKKGRFSEDRFNPFVSETKSGVLLIRL